MMITVQNLIDDLLACDPKAIIVLSSDAEGNGFDTLFEVSNEYRYHPVRREIGYRELTAEMREQGYSEEDVMEDGQLAVVLWP